MPSTTFVKWLPLLTVLDLLKYSNVNYNFVLMYLSGLFRIFIALFWYFLWCYLLMMHRTFYILRPTHIYGKNKRCKDSMLNVLDSLIVNIFLVPRSHVICWNQKLLQKPLALISVQYIIHFITNYSKLWNPLIFDCSLIVIDCIILFVLFIV